MAPWYIVRITETQVNSWLVVALIVLLCFWLTRDMKVTPEGKKQIIAEFLVENVPLRELQTQRRGARLSLGGIGAGAPAVQFDHQIVLVAAGETLSALELRVAVALLMFADLRLDIALRRQRIRHGAHGLIIDGELLPAAGKVRVDRVCRRGEPPGIRRAVADELCRDAAHLV